MATPKSVFDLLLTQPPEVLAEMRAAAVARRDEAQAELDQLDKALAKRSRRGSLGAKKPYNRTGLKREDVYAVMEAVARPMTAPEVRDVFVSRGVDASTNAIRNHLERLVEQNHLLVRLEGARYVIAARNGLESRTEADPPLLRENQLQSQES